MAKQTFDGQHEDETVINVHRKHPVVMRKGLIFMMLFWVGVLLPYSFFFDRDWALPMLLIGFGLGVLVMFYAWIGWFFTLFIVTDQRFIQIIQKGLFRRSVVDLGLDKVQNINFQIAGLQETLLGFGTISIQTFVGDLILEQMHHPQKIQEELIRVIKENGYTLQETSGTLQETKAEDE